MKALLSSILRVRPRRGFHPTLSPRNSTSIVVVQWRCFSSGFLEHWKTQIQNGKLRPDKAQEKVVKRLNRLQQAMVGYSNEGFFLQPTVVEDEKESNEAEEEKADNKLMTREQDPHNSIIEKPPPPPPLPRIPRGLYIHGPVGTGKSLLMDTFYHTLDTTPHKARYHFHAFLAQVHSRIHQLNQYDLQTKGRNFSIDTSRQQNPIVRVALELAQHTTLLCLDEFQVTDVADAMILKQLFQVLWAHGTVVVATSNRPPEDLYEGGLNYGYFAPFIDLLHRHCIVHSLESPLGDYRQVLSAEPPPLLSTSSIGSANPTTTVLDRAPFFWGEKETSKVDDAAIDRLVQDLCRELNQPTNNPQLESFDLTVGFGRTIKVTSGDSNGLIGVFAFEELCDGDLGASDYRAVAQHFSVVVLQSIPRLSTFHHNRARRFITLVDELYEGKCALVVSCSAPVTRPVELFPPSEPDIVGGSSTSSSTTTIGDLNLEETLGLEDIQTQGGQPVSTLASVRELSFAFRRAASRITEMTSQRWWKQVLQGDGWIID